MKLFLYLSIPLLILDQASKWWIVDTFNEPPKQGEPYLVEPGYRQALETWVHTDELTESDNLLNERLTELLDLAVGEREGDHDRCNPEPGEDLCDREPRVDINLPCVLVDIGLEKLPELPA